MDISESQDRVETADVVERLAARWENMNYLCCFGYLGYHQYNIWGSDYFASV